MLLGFQYVVLVAILFYAISAIGLQRTHDIEGKERGQAHLPNLRDSPIA
jgi:hypothetical protein